MFEKIESVFKKIDKVISWLIVLSLGGMTCAIFLQVIFRYVLNSPLAWTEEISVFMFIWMTFLAGYVGARRGKHIGVVGIRNKLPKVGEMIFEFIAHAISAIFFFIIVVSTTMFMPKLHTQTSPALGLPMAYVYLVMIIGSLLMAVWYSLLAVRCLMNTKTGKES
ncbi:MAG: TRAP transporter small permease [Sphaerochaetaceae bacterium]|nr:TRAP transporter small permease [Sphaerochaetaceae bacterium]